MKKWNHGIFGMPYFALRFAEGAGGPEGGASANDAGAPGTETAAEGSSAGAEGTAAAETQEEKQFSQSDLDTAIEKRLARERKKWERENNKQQPANPGTTAGEPEKETNPAQDDSAEKISKANARLVKAEAKAAAIAAGVKPEKIPYVVKLADLDGIDVDDDEGPDGDAIKKAIDKVLKDMPEFKAQASGSSDSGFQIGADGQNQGGGKPAQSVKPSAAAQGKRWNRFRQ